MSDPLPGPVRSRVVALAADALPQLSEVPPSLRKVASFAPTRRARLGATPIATALEVDDDFRERVGVQVGAVLPELTRALDEGAVPSAADPVEVAALAWLTRPDGWEELLATVTNQIETAPSPQDAAAVERLEKRVASLESAARDTKAAHQEELAAARAEHTTLRHRLGEARAAQRAAGAETDDARRQLDQLQASATVARSSAEAEVRRLRGRISELEAQVAAGRRESRTGRDEVTARTRMLLDTLIEAGQGLRRELALPPTDGLPADRVEAEITARAEATAGGATSYPALGATQVERFLGMPRARLIIDGYNVSKTAWPESALDAQRIRLMSALGPLVARVGAETTVVFDAAGASHRQGVVAPRGVRVLFSPEGVIADDVIRELVAAEPTGRVVLVATSDQELSRDVVATGARVVTSPTFLSVLG